MVEFNSEKVLQRIRELLGVIQKDDSRYAELVELANLVKELDERLTSGKDTIPDDWDSRYKLPPKSDDLPGMWEASDLTGGETDCQKD